AGHPVLGAAAVLHRTRAADISAGLVQAAVPIALAQGRFGGRTSRIAVVQDPAGRLLVSGEVWPVSHGVLDFDPRAIEP
ncbi:MAG TPA: hypothetical protein PK201_10220, partial [Accumulibacter sp.]|nr:hypothetical protein [Accumulibacter sp.]